ncbi:MAG: undecaprenyl-diphosphate phosphatase [Caldilineales bacterium]
MSAISIAELWRVILLGIVEGITEFLPISSTGHLIIASDLLDFSGSVGGTFEIFIQLGAVLAVVWYYRRDLWQQVRSVPHDRAVQRFWLNGLIAFLPAALLGLLVHDWIKARLFNPVTVALALIGGGVVLWWVERRVHRSSTTSLYEMTPQQALGVGLAQTLALIPGMSRSASSIIGGLLTGLDRATATAFSFYLAIPTLGLATLVDLAGSLDQLSSGDMLNLLVGTVVSFFVAWLAVGWLLRYIARNNFTSFAVYRIGFGLLVLAWFTLR